MSSNDLLLEARGIGRRAPGSDGWLLHDISLEVFAGDRIALVGPSGAGKTLLLRSLALLDHLDAGEICWQGQPIRNDAVPTFRRQVIYLHQRPALFEGSVETILRMPFELQAHRGSRFDRQRVVHLLTALGRDASFLAKAQHELSGGEGQIVALLRAVQLDPAVLLLDEPTAALDPDAGRSIAQLVDGWLGERPDARALVWVTHNPAQTEGVLCRTIHLREGRIEKEERK
jgi:putative ABC transport system ATP-binding protein